MVMERGGFGSELEEGSKLDLDLKDLMEERRRSKLNQAIQGDVEGTSMEFSQHKSFVVSM